MDEETQLALALSISEAEIADNPSKFPVSNANHLPSGQQKSDTEYAKELQQKFDKEAAHLPTNTAPPQPNNNANSNTYVDPGFCAGCHQPLVSFHKKPSTGGGGLFSSLAASLVGPTQTRYITALGKNWHPNCLKCSMCHQPLSAQFTISETGDPMHPNCHQKAFHPRCTVCSNFLPQEPGSNRIVWQVSPFWGDKTCPSHSTDGTKRCTACQRLQPHSEQWADLDDGRALCLCCLGTVIPNTTTAQPLYDSILDFYLRQGMQLPTKPPLSLVSNSALNTATDQQGANRTDGPIFHTRGLCLTEYSQSIRKTVWLGSSSEVRGPKKCTVTAILVLSGLPRLLTGCILAHELMHAWLRLSGFEDLPLEIEEGLCQLMALLWLEAQPESQGGSNSGGGGGGGSSNRTYDEKLASFLGNQIRTDTSIVYGDGLRAALDAFQRHGLATLLAHVRQAKRLP